MEDFSDLTARVQSDARVLGLVLSGSQAREGTATEHSDHDIYLVVADEAADAMSAETRRDARLDVVVMPLREFRPHALSGSGTEWNRRCTGGCARTTSIWSGSWTTIPWTGPNGLATGWSRG
ncbi:hypothetical protein [Nonomuraea rosea]|uniref:hypothetical protein n=1 Tax=Nonomuraea rosea TaxID=638574 RepID=UPI0031E539CB